MKRSQSRNLRERLLKYVNYRTYRCVHCGWRGVVPSKGTGRTYKTTKTYLWWQLVIIAIVLVAGVVFVLYWIQTEPPPPATYGKTGCIIQVS